jgi:hypothetical protein
MSFFLVTDLQLQHGLSFNTLTKQTHIWTLDSHINGIPFVLLKGLWILARDDSDSDYKDKMGRRCHFHFEIRESE